MSLLLHHWGPRRPVSSHGGISWTPKNILSHAKRSHGFSTPKTNKSLSTFVGEVEQGLRADVLEDIEGLTLGTESYVWSVDYALKSTACQIAI
jgi:hypothetical protein